jgi:Cu(I)-responsive transcriptional regulator
MISLIKIRIESIVAIGSNMQREFSIGDLAKQSGAKIVTIRYYEQIGLLPACKRTSGNYRIYSQQHFERLRFVRRCRDLGFSLEQIRNLLSMSSAEASSCADICEMAARHLREVEAKIADLKRLASELRQISTSCNGKRPIADCRIIAALSRN